MQSVHLYISVIFNQEKAINRYFMYINTYYSFSLSHLCQVVFSFYLTTAKAQLSLGHKGKIVHSFLKKKKNYYIIIH